MLRVYVFYGLVGLVGLCALWYLAVMRRWARVLGTPEFQNLSEAQRADYMSTPEYRKLRGAVRYPIMACLVLFAALYFVMRNPF